MDPARPRNGVRDPGPPTKKQLVIVDMHNTLVKPVGGKSQALLVYEQAESVLGKLPMSYRTLACRTRALRLRLEEQLPENGRSGVAYWGLVNSQILGCDAGKAIEISRRLTTNPDLYEMPDDRRLFFTWLFEEKFPSDVAMLAIASNSDRRSVCALLEKIGMKKYFATDRIFTPETMNGAGKPSSMYFENVLRAMGVEPKLAVDFGNSPFHDVPAARVGMDVVWLRDNEEVISRAAIRKHLGAESMKLVHTVRRIEDARRIVDAKFVRMK